MKKKKQAAKKQVSRKRIAVMHDNLHKSSKDVAARRDLMTYELEQTDTAIEALRNELADKQRRRRDILEEIDGLSAVIDSRFSPCL